MTQEYVDELTATYIGIREVWLLGSRAMAIATDASDWDYLAFLEDDSLFNTLAQDAGWKRTGIDLLLVPTPWDIACCPWTEKNGHRKKLDLGNQIDGSMDWRQISSTEATYRPLADRNADGPIGPATTPRLAKAVRVYPRS